VNVSDPTNPVLVGDYITSGWIRDVQVRGNLAYLACTENLDIIDVSDPANPTLISSYDVTGSITKIALREQYVYTAGDSGLVAVNVSDPAAPWENGRYMPALQIWEHLDTRDLEIVGDYAYLAGHDMEIVNVSDPSMPVLVGEYDAINALRGGIAVEGGIECKGYGTGGTAADGPTLYAFVLGQNYPNPFNPTTTIGFTLDRNTPVTLSIYDVSGKLVRTLVEEQLPVGQYQRSWHGRDNNGQPVATGVYFYRLVAGERTETRKMVLLK
jgi:hypothetical protein